ncbi:restriction endonuclease subunit S [Alishewanella jeotgali]|uniref:Restriction endonuclease S subunits-like protein n=1 Tax=Alishewanella jeotgali KCTC 22429 TaxID=1129374 RepID=H3ZFE8_9ALTE|nr:restriction endonuclease subunit S [Alishewanella jeotgali]EHR40709.1 restriction endonuclease S subunits-like protein [Alishewanella jeotgali KCTC 22429]
MSWPVVELGSVVSFIGGSQPPKSEFKYEAQDGYVRLLQIRDYKSDDNLTYIPAKSTKKFCSKDDVMIGRYGPPVFQILRGLEGAYNVALMKAQPSELVDKDYLYYFLKQEKLFRLIDGLSQRTAGQSGVDMDALKAYPMILPPVAEQKRIAAILDKADAIRRKRQQAIQLADDFLRAVFLEMFGDPVTNPKGWDRQSLDRVAPVLPLKKKVAEHENVWLINLDAIEAQSGKIIHKLIVPYAEVGSSTNHFNETHVLYSKLRPYLNKVVIPNSEGMATSELLTLLPSPKKITREFLATYLRSNAFVSWANTKVAGAKMPRLSTVELKKHQIFVPPLQLQQEFSQKFRHVLDMAERSNEVLKNNDSFFSCLSQKAFSGQL